MIRSFLIETPTFTCPISISEGIVIASGSLKWADGKKEELLWNWLNKKFGTDLKKTEQLRMM